MSNFNVNDLSSCFTTYLSPLPPECPSCPRYTFAILIIASFGLFLTSILGFSGAISLSRDVSFGLLGGGLLFCGQVILVLMKMAVSGYVKICKPNTAIV